MQIEIFDLKKSGLNKVSLSPGSKTLDVKMIGGDLKMFCLTDDNKDTDDRNFQAYKTGEEIDFHDNNLKHISTTDINKGEEIYHVFEILE